MTRSAMVAGLLAVTSLAAAAEPRPDGDPEPALPPTDPPVFSGDPAALLPESDQADTSEVESASPTASLAWPAAVTPNPVSTESDVLAPPPPVSDASVSATGVGPSGDDPVAIVPSLPAISAFGRSSARADGRGIAITGYIDGLVDIADREENVPDGDGTDGTAVDWRTGIDLEVRARPTQWVQLVGEIRMEGADLGEDPNRFELQQAYVRMQVSDDLAVTAGRFHQWFGWERFDEPELWRINRSFTYYNSGNMDGVGIHWAMSETWELHGYVVDEVVTPDDSAEGKDNYELGYGASLRWRPDPGTLIKVEGYYDFNTAPDVATTDDVGSVLTVSFNGEWERMLGTGFSGSWDFAWGDNPNGWQFFALAALRYDWESDSLPGFTTLMVNYFDENYDRSARNAEAAAGRNLFNNKRGEVALAGFVFPTQDYRYRLGAELRSIDNSVDNADLWQLSVQVLAILP